MLEDSRFGVRSYGAIEACYGVGMWRHEVWMSRYRCIDMKKLKSRALRKRGRCEDMDMAAGCRRRDMEV